MTSTSTLPGGTPPASAASGTYTLSSRLVRGDAFQDGQQIGRAHV